MKEMLARAASSKVVILDARPETSTRQGTSRERSRFRSRRCGGGSRTCRRARNTSRIVAGRTASTRTGPWSCCARADAVRAGWRVDFRSGRPRGFRSPKSRKGTDDFQTLLLLRDRLRGLSVRLRQPRQMRGRRSPRARRRRVRRVRRVEGHAHHPRHRHARACRSPLWRPRARKADRRAYCLHESADVALPFEPLRDGQEIELGNTRVKVLHTPGHTPESMCLLVRICVAAQSRGSC